MLCICITGFAADPEAVTEALGVEPTSVRRVSDGGPHPFNAWWFEGHEADLLSGGDHARGFANLRAILVGREAAFQHVAATLKPTNMHVYGGLHHAEDEQCGIWLDVEDMRLLAACGLEWGLEVVTREPDGGS